MSKLGEFYHADMEADESDDEDFGSEDDIQSDVDIDPEDDADMDGFIAREDEEVEEDAPRDPEDLADYDEGLTKDDLDLLAEARGEAPRRERDTLDEDIDDDVRDEEEAPKRKFKKIKKGRLRKRSLSPDAGSVLGIDDEDMVDDDRRRTSRGISAEHSSPKRPRLMEDFVVDDLGEEPRDIDEYQMRRYTGMQMDEGPMALASSIFGGGLREFMKAGIFGSKRAAVDEAAMEMPPPVRRKSPVYDELTGELIDDGEEATTAAEKEAAGEKLSEAEEKKLVLGSDIPERMQPRLRDVNVTEMGLMDEASYIKRMAFDKRDRVPESTIREVLKMILKEKLEVPFIKLYRQGVWSTTDFPLREEDLWTIHDWDQKYHHFSQRKERLTTAVKAVQDDTQREAVFRFLEQADTEADLDDVQEFVNSMNDGEEKEDEEVDEDGQKIKFKRPKKRGALLPSVEGLEEFLEVIGSATSLGNSVYHRRQTASPANPHKSPRTMALECVTTRLRSADAVISASVRHLAREISLNPNVRRKVREHYFDHARISTTVTRKGRNEIDWMSEYIIVKRIVNEPVYSFTEDFRNFERRLESPNDPDIPGSLPERFAVLTAAEEAGLLTSTVALPEDLKLGEGAGASVELLPWLKSLYCSPSNADGQDAWNAIRTQVLEDALKHYLNSVGKTYVRDTLLADSRRLLARQVVEELDNRLKVDEYAKFNAGRTIFGFHIGDFDKPSMCCALSDHGLLVAEQIYHHFKNRIPSKRARENNLELHMNSKGVIKKKMEDIQRFKEFLNNHRPTMVVVGAEDMTSPNVLTDIKNACQSMQPQPRVEFVNPDVARIFQTSFRAEREFQNAAPGMRSAIAMARMVLDPVSELAAMWLADPLTKQRDIVSFQMHHLQRILPEELMLKEVQRVLIDKINHYGVDLNALIHHPHKQAVLEHVCGLGPILADSLIGKVVGFCQSRRSLQAHNEAELARALAPAIYKNCIGFLRIVSNKESRAWRAAGQEFDDDDRDTEHEGFQHEFLDSTRIHPESYEYAVQVAWDELHQEATDEEREADLTGLMEYQDRVESLIGQLRSEMDSFKELDVATYATHLQAEADGPAALDRNIHSMLKLIERELFRPYFSSRTPFQSPERHELFWLLTHETPRTLRIGMIVDATVHAVARDFVVVKLGCGVEGRIYFRSLTEQEQMPEEDKAKEWAQTLVRRDQAVRGRVKNINFDYQTVELDCRESIMRDTQFEDAAAFYNVKSFNKYLDLESDDKILAEEEMKQEKVAKKYISRHVDFPLFKNFDREQAEKSLESKDVGAIIVRPSSKGLDFLTISWKISADPFICVHVEVKEKDKENKYEVGQTLEIGHMKFEDLDEIHANYFEHMTAKLRELTQYPEFRYGTEQEINELVTYDKKNMPNKITYAIGFSMEHPGWFRLVYVFNRTPLAEFIRLEYNGYRFRKRKFSKPKQLIDWFKRHPTDGSPYRQQHQQRRSNGHHSSSRHGESSSSSSHYGSRTPHRDDRHHSRSSKYSGYDDHSRSSRHGHSSRHGSRTPLQHSRSSGGYSQQHYDAGGNATPSHKHDERGGGYRR